MRGSKFETIPRAPGQWIANPSTLRSHIIFYQNPKFEDYEIIGEGHTDRVNELNRAFFLNMF
jgi:hypothetical protein